MSRLKSNSNVPELKGNTLSGKKLSLSDYRGKPLILSFYRYAGCQFCNLRMHDFVKHYHNKYHPAGIEAIAVFQSPIRKLQKYTSEHEAPFEIVSDPDYAWYKAFHVEKSWLGFARSGFKFGDFYRSVAKGYGRIDPDGSMNRLPADFLIGPNGKIDMAYYGSDIGDHIPFKRIDKWMNHIQLEV